MVPDSGGAGQWRGGLALRREYELLEDATVIRRFNKIKFPPAGLAGGEAGTPARFVVRLGTEQEVETKASARFEMKAGERFLLQSAGGGGYGDPAKRDAAARCPRCGRRLCTTKAIDNGRGRDRNVILKLARRRGHGEPDHAARHDRGSLPPAAGRHRPDPAVPQHQPRHRGRIRDHDAALREARRAARRAELRHHPSQRRAAVHGARLQGRGEDRRGLGEEVQDAGSAASRRTTCARSRR